MEKSVPVAFGAQRGRDPIHPKGAAVEAVLLAWRLWVGLRRSASWSACPDSRRSDLGGVRSRPKRPLMSGTDTHSSHASWHRLEEGKIAQRGDDGIHREAGLQDGENPAHHPKAYHSDTCDEWPGEQHAA